MYNMNQRKSKIGIIIMLALTVGGMLTCQFSEQAKRSIPDHADTTLFTAWKKEKTDLIAVYENKLKRLASRQDSLSKEISQKKMLLSIAATNTKAAERKLQSFLSGLSGITVPVDSIKPFVDSLAFACNVSDSLCTETIETLETQIESKDSSLIQQSAEITLLKQIGVQQELRMNDLQATVDSQARSLNKSVRRGKILSFGIAVLAGLAGSLFLIQTGR